MKTTKEQRAAIELLVSALERCRMTDVGVFAMDDTIYVTTEHDYRKDFHENYQAASGGDPDRMSAILIGAPFIGCGGW